MLIKFVWKAALSARLKVFGVRHLLFFSFLQMIYQNKQSFQNVMYGIIEKKLTAVV